MIQLSDLTKSFGDRTLLDHVTWQIGDGDRVGLCGPNGAGKTTLLKMLAGLDEPDSGAIVKPADLTIGYLPQDGLTHSGRTVFEEASSAFQPLLDMKAEMHDIEHRLGDAVGAARPSTTRCSSRYSRAAGPLPARATATAWTCASPRCCAASASARRTPSGRPRRSPAAGRCASRWPSCCSAGPNLLLLDEPTNHLDLDARNWLEEYLGAYPVRRDPRLARPLLPRRGRDAHHRPATCARSTDYVGNYSKYVEQRDAMLERLRQAKREQDEEVARVKMFIDRFRYQATKAAQVQSRIKMLEKVVPIEVPPERKRIHFTFPALRQERPHGARAEARAQGLRHRSRSSSDVDLHIERGDRIALVGPNGAGKSTLMRMLSGEEAPDAGTRTVGHQVVMEYFAQDEATRLDPTLTVYETLAGRLADRHGAGDPQHPRRLPVLRRRHLQEGGVLSGGERTRLAVARMLLRPSNTLLLDEPTNHLDLDSKDVLLDALEDYGGTLILVSHDRYFVEKLATKIIEIGHGEAHRLSGHLRGVSLEQGAPADDAQARRPTRQAPKPRKAQSRQPQGPEPRAAAGQRRSADRSPSAEDRSAGPRGAEAAGRRAQEEAAGRRGAAASGSPSSKARIAEREAEVKELEAAMAAPGFYDDRDASKPVIDRHQALMWEVGDLMAQWEALQEHAAGARPSES